jgi:hypothetical protein
MPEKTGEPHAFDFTSHVTSAMTPHLSPSGALMPRKMPRKLGLATFVVLILTDLQLYVLRFHPPTEMLGRYLRQYVVPNGSPEPFGGDFSDPDTRYRMDAPLRKV